MPPSTADVIRDYVAAWGEKDAAKRQALLERCWGDDACPLSPKPSTAHGSIVGGERAERRAPAGRARNARA